jgi:hypothetical protein
MCRDIHTKNERIAFLESRMEEQKKSYEAELMTLWQKMDDGVAEKQMQMQHMEANLQDQVDMLTQKLKVTAMPCTLAPWRLQQQWFPTLHADTLPTGQTRAHLVNSRTLRNTCERRRSLSGTGFACTPKTMPCKTS